MKILLLLAVLGQACFAGQLEVEYSSFYSHLKKIDKEDLNALQFAFGFKKVEKSTLCHINHAAVITQKVTFPVEINAFERFTLPTEKALKMAKAVVSLDLTEPNNQCDMSVQLETKAEYLKTNYSVADLAMLNEQYKTFFDDMGSFLSFLMPSTKGLKLVFAQPPQVNSQHDGLSIVANELILSDDWLEAMSSELILAEKPLRIMAIVEK
ncbi:DUF2987 domain-containing protein [Paraglaciecola sp.]|uniref:DUF2987 domain-containing protein n=1 Tax=Paraglaciecola sp. TaxID=1920173 RepID=UPI0030F3D60F